MQRPAHRAWIITVQAPEELRARVAAVVNLDRWGATKKFVVEAIEGAVARIETERRERSKKA